MAADRTAADKGFELLRKLVEVKRVSSKELLIVDREALQRIAQLIPIESLRSAAGAQIVAPDSSLALPLSDWFKTARARTGLSQRKFAALVAQSGIKISGSDIGNIETNYRVGLYRSERIEEFKEAIRRTLEAFESSRG